MSNARTALDVIDGLNSLVKQLEAAQRRIAVLERENANQATLISEMRNDMASAIAIGLRMGKLVKDMAAVAELSDDIKSQQET